MESGHTRNASSAGSKAWGGSPGLSLSSAAGRDPDTRRHLRATVNGGGARVPRSTEPSLPALSMVRQPATGLAARRRAPPLTLTPRVRPARPRPWVRWERSPTGGASALVPSALVPSAFLTRLLLPGHRSVTEGAGGSGSPLVAVLWRLQTTPETELKPQGAGRHTGVGWDLRGYQQNDISNPPIVLGMLKAFICFM